MWKRRLSLTHCSLPWWWTNNNMTYTLFVIFITENSFNKMSYNAKIIGHLDAFRPPIIQPWNLELGNIGNNQQELYSFLALLHVLFSCVVFQKECLHTNSRCFLCLHIKRFLIILNIFLLSLSPLFYSCCYVDVKLFQCLWNNSSQK